MISPGMSSDGDDAATPKLWADWTKVDTPSAELTAAIEAARIELDAHRGACAAATLGWRVLADSIEKSDAVAATAIPRAEARLPAVLKSVAVEAASVRERKATLRALTFRWLWKRMLPKGMR
jgi:hypothetical protein